MPKQMVVYAIFTRERAASRAVENLVEAHFDVADITVLSREDGDGEARIETLPVEVHTHAGMGGTIGAVLGALGGVALTIVAPWIGIGPLAVILEAAAVGAVTGGAAGFLGGLNEEDLEIEFDAEHFPAGSFLVGAMTASRTEQASAALRAAGAPAVFTRTPEEALRAFHMPQAPPPAPDKDTVVEAGSESFPASDPPAWNPPGH